MELEYQNIVTAETYLKERGVDLSIELTTVYTSDLGENAVQQFIHQIEEYIRDYFTSDYSWNGVLKTTWQTKQFTKAVIYQIDYVLAHPEVLNLSGLTSAGQLIDHSKLLELGLHHMCYKCMHNGGMANLRGC